MQHMVYDLIQNLIIITLCLMIVYPKANKRYRDKKITREIQREQERKEFIHQVVNEYLKKLQNDGGKD